MNDHASARNDSRSSRRLRFGMKDLAVLVAVSGLIAWAGRHIWNDFNKSEDTRVFEEIVERLQSSDASERWRAAGNLHIVKRTSEIEPAIAALTRALHDKDPQVRDVSARSLGALVHRLRVPSGSDVIAAPEVVLSFTDLATTALVKLLSDPTESVRVGAAVGIGMLAKQPNSASSGGRLASPMMKAGAGTSETPSWKPPRELADSLKTGQEKWSRATAKAYYGYLDSPPPTALVAALRDESAAVRAEAVRSLENYPLDLDSAIPELLSMVEKDGVEVRSIADATLRKAWPTPVVVPNLAAALKSGDGKVRNLAVLLLGRIGPDASSTVPALREILIETLESKDLTLVENAAKSLAKFGKDAGVAIPKLRSLKANEKSEAGAAAAAALDAIEDTSPPKRQTSPST
jgi:HEAT repeat protein